MLGGSRPYGPGPRHAMRALRARRRRTVTRDVLGCRHGPSDVPIQVPVRDMEMGKELRAQFPKRRHHYYRIACAWCKRCIGWKLKNVSVPGDTTYGICPPCAADM